MKALTFGLALVAITSAASAQQQTLRDSSGRTIGTVTTDSQGSMTYRDASGRTMGTASVNGHGTTTFRDAFGRTSGSVSGGKR